MANEHCETVPDPARASDLEVSFIADDHSTSTLEFKHLNFQDHGEGAEAYRENMNAEQGWDYLLNRYKAYCEKQH